MAAQAILCGMQVAGQDRFKDPALLIGSIIGFATVPLAGWLSDKLGGRTMYRALSGFQMLFAIPAILLMQSRDPFLVSLALIIGLSVSVLGMFSVQSAYVNELFGSRNRYTQPLHAAGTGQGNRRCAFRPRRARAPRRPCAAAAR
jgi:MFS family permease